MRHMKWWGWGEDGFCITRPGWSSEQASDLDECIGNSVRVLAIIGKRIFLDFRRPATGHANLVSGVGSAEMDRSSG